MYGETHGILLNVEDVREENINVSGHWWMPVKRELNDRAILIEEVREALNEMKSVRLHAWMNSSGVFKERWNGSVRIASETVERKF